MFDKMRNALTGNQQEQPAAAGAKDQIKPDGMNDAGKSETNPLDAFKDMYKVDEADKGQAATAPKLDLSNEVLDKVVPNIDFMAGLSAEVKQGLASGDPQAIVSAMQATAANGYKAAMQHNAALMNDHLDQRFEGFKPAVADSVAQQMTSHEVAKLPNAENPVIRAELDRVSTQLRNKFPSADSAWIAKQANTYLVELGTQLSGTPQAQQQEAQLPESVDFAALSNGRL